MNPNKIAHYLRILQAFTITWLLVSGLCLGFEKEYDHATYQLILMFIIMNIKLENKS